MDGDDDRMAEDCYSNASFVSKLTLSFPYQFMRKALRATVGVEDIPRLPPTISVETCGAQLLSAFAANPDASLIYVLLTMTKRSFVSSFVLALVWSSMFILTPSFLFPGLVRFLQDATQVEYVGWVYVAAFFVATVLSNFCYSLAWFHSAIAALQSKSALVAVVIDVALSESAAAAGASETGKYTNAVANDAERCFTFLLHLAFGLSSCLGLVGMFVSLYFWMGPAPASLVLVLVVLQFLLQRVLAMKNAALRSSLAPVTDEVRDAAL